MEHLLHAHAGLSRSTLSNKQKIPMNISHIIVKENRLSQKNISHGPCSSILLQYYAGAEIQYTLPDRSHIYYKTGCRPQLCMFVCMQCMRTLGCPLCLIIRVIFCSLLSLPTSFSSPLSSRLHHSPVSAPLYFISPSRI